MALKAKQSELSTRSQNYLTFTVTDDAYGATTFYWGDTAFSANNAYGGAWVQPVILDWGSLVKYLPEGTLREDQTTIRLALHAEAVPSDQAVSFTIYQILQNFNFRDRLVTVYQWNEGDSSQEVIWKGYWGGVTGYGFAGGVGTVDVSLSSLERGSSDTIGSIITRSAFPTAPATSFGLMSPKVYGSFRTTVDSTNHDATNVLTPIILGYSQRAPVAIATSEAFSASSIGTRYRVAQNDGVSAADVYQSGTIDSATVSGLTVTDFHVYDDSIGAYGLIEDASILGNLNDTSEIRVDVTNAPQVFFAVRPSVKHTSTSAGITDISPPVNDDPTDYLTLTEANPVAAWECPAFSIPSGAEVSQVRVAVEMYWNGVNGGNGVAVGIWDPYTGGGQFWGNANHYQNFTSVSFGVGSKRSQWRTTGTGGAGVWGQWAAESANTTGTLPEFVGGRLVGIDAAANNQRKPLVIRLQWNATPAGGATFRVYSVALLAKVKYPKVKIGNAPLTLHRWKPKEGQITIVGAGKPILGDPKAPPGLQVISTGRFQEDDGSGTITGTAGAVIQKAPDIARHLLQVVGGKTVNSTAGTLGNFVDARTEGTAGELSINATFGPSEPVSRVDALEQIMQRWPIRLYQNDGVWRCIHNEMNPHSSRAYPDPLEIEPWDIIDGSLDVKELDSRQFVNKVTVSGGHSYGRNEPLASYTYNNPLSQMYWGASQEQTIDEPWCPVTDLATGASESIKHLARFYGRVSARPRLTVRVRLTQKFYDLQPGHVLQFSRNMESAGIFCPAYRAGRLDYLYNADVSVTNGANDPTPSLIGGGAVDREMYLGFSQQTDQFTFTNTAGAASYTDSANPWQYYDGTTWVDLTGVLASDGGATANVLERLGTITVSFDRPTITSWRKAELTIGSELRGPCYWMRHKAVNVITSCTGDALTTIPARWWGRLFEVIETNRSVGAGGYPSMEAVLMEVM